MLGVDRIKAISTAPALSLSSQLVGMAQLALLLLRVGANEATDAYFYLFNLGMVPIHGIIVGVMYPSLLNEERLSKRNIATIRWLTPLICLTAVAAGAGWLWANDRLQESLFLLVLMCMANAVVQARLWYRAVAAEAGGNASWIAGVALPPNLIATIALLISWQSATAAISAMVGGLLLGNLGLLGVMASRAVGQSVVERQASVLPFRRGPLWFFSMASSGLVARTVLQSLAVFLPPSSITLLNVAFKIVSSVSATFINATMPLLVHSESDSLRPGRRFLRVVTIVVIASAAVTLSAVGLFEHEYLLPATVTAAWLVGSSAAAVANRMSYRFLTPRAMGTRSMPVLAVIIGSAVLTSYQPGFTLIALLCAYAAIDGANAALLLWALKDRLISVLNATLVLGVVGIWVVVAL
jgi:hypothetical protein